MANDIVNINVSETVETVAITVNPNLTTVNINRQVPVGVNGQDLQSVTNLGATTTNPITITVGDGGANGITSFSSQGYGIKGESSESSGVYGVSVSTGVYGFGETGVIGEGSTGVKGIGTDFGVDGNSINGVGILASTDIGIGVSAIADSTGVGIYAYSTSGKGIEVYGNGTISVDVNLGSTNKGVVIDSGTSSTGNPIEVNKNGVNKLTVNQQGELTATKLKKDGGTSNQFLMADGSVSTGGGGGGATNLTTSQTSSNFTINSDTGTDASVPLGNGTLAGATLNDYTTAEKNKLAGIEAGANLGVPYTGATSDVNLGEFGIQLGNLEFDNTPTNIPTAAGSMYYNDTDGTLDLILKGGNVKLQIGQESVVRVVNKTSTNIDLLEANYQAVRVTGAQGQRLKVDLAQATNDLLSAETIGLVTETITNNQEGFITTSGLVRNINTTGSLQSETWLDGDVLYLSPTVAGRITKVKPQAPNHLVIIGYVIYAHVTQGTIFVKVDNGYELDELHNVKIDAVTNNEVLAYTSATDIWENKTPSEAGLQPTLVSTTNIKTINGTTILGSGDLVVSGTGISSLNGLTGATQTFSVFTNFTGSPSFSSTGTNHQLRLPNAGSGTDYGLITNTTQTIAGNKAFPNNIQIPVPAENTQSCIVLGSAGGGSATSQLNIGSTTLYPTGQEMQNVKGVTTPIQTQLNGKQATLTAGSGIDITSNTISTSPQTAYTVLANNTNATAVPTAQVFKDIAEQSISNTNIVWTGTTAPSGTSNHTYKWSQIGKLVTLRVSLNYTGAGSAVTSVSIPFDNMIDLPAPATITGFTGNGEVVSFGSGMFGATKTIPSLATIGTGFSLIRKNLAGTGTVPYDLCISRNSASHQYAFATIQYYTT